MFQWYFRTCHIQLTDRIDHKFTKKLMMIRISLFVEWNSLISEQKQNKNTFFPLIDLKMKSQWLAHVWFRSSFFFESSLCVCVCFGNNSTMFINCGMWWWERFLHANRCNAYDQFYPPTHAHCTHCNIRTMCWNMHVCRSSFIESTSISFAKAHKSVCVCKLKTNKSLTHSGSHSPTHFCLHFTFLRCVIQSFHICRIVLVALAIVRRKRSNKNQSEKCNWRRKYNPFVHIRIEFHFHYHQMVHVASFSIPPPRILINARKVSSQLQYEPCNE